MPEHRLLLFCWTPARPPTPKHQRQATGVFLGIMAKCAGLVWSDIRRNERKELRLNWAQGAKWMAKTGQFHELLLVQIHLERWS